MARSIARVEEGVLYPAAGAASPILLDDPAWYAWLDAHASFSCVTPGGAVTIRKERGRPSGWYWKAYRREAGKVRTAYLGRSVELSRARLYAAADILTGTAAPQTAPLPQPLPLPAGAPDASPQADLGALVRTKFFIPAPRPQGVPRLRLLTRLRTTTLPPVILVAAPAGYGKTTLIANWIAADQRTAAWLSLDAGDNDPGVFWSAVATTLGTLHPEAGARALHLLHSPQPPPLPTVLALLLNDLATHVGLDAAGRAALLVLDDYHIITQRAIHETVTALIEHLPPALRLVLTSRADPPLRLARLRVREQILEIRTGDLAFDASETTAFLLDTMGLALPDGSAATLAARTEGWVAALQLAALSLRTQVDPAAFIASFGGSHRPLLAYLLDEVFNRQPPAQQEFLLATAVLDQMCAELCAAVLSRSEAEATQPGAGDIGTWRAAAGAQALLEELDAANLFVVALDTTGRWFRYHRLFAEMLRHRLRLRDPAWERACRRRASAWYAQAGYGHEAIAQALAAQDWDAAADLIAHFAEEVRRRGDLSTLAGWLGALPPPLLHADPRLALLQAWLLLFENQFAAVEPWLDDVERGLAQAETAGPRPGDSAGGAALGPLRGRAAVIRARVERVLHVDLAQSKMHAHLALAQLPAADLEWRTTALLSLATASYGGDDLEQALYYYQEAGALSVRGGFYMLTCLIRSWTSVLLYDLGRLQEAQALCAETRRWVAGDLPGTCQLDWAEALLRYEFADLPEAERLLERAITLAAQGRQLEIQGFAYLTWSQIRLARGSPDGALRALDAAAALLTPPGTGAAIYQQMLSAWQATALLARAARSGLPAGGLEGALACALGAPGTELPDAPASVAHWLWRPTHLLPARARVAQGDRAGALAYLELCGARAAACGAQTLRIATLALQAVILADLGRGAAARAALLRACALGADEGHIRSILDAGPAVGPLLSGLARDLTRRPDTSPAFLAYVYRLRDAAAPGAARSPADCLAAPPAGNTTAGSPDRPLTDRELAILRLLGAGCSNQEIADRLILAVSTVKWYLRAIYEKLDSGNRTQAVARARVFGLIP